MSTSRENRILRLYPQAGWLSAGELMEIVDVSARHLQRLRKLGLPSRVSRGRHEYPAPDAIAWLFAYQSRVERGARVRFLPLDLALAEYHASSFAESPPSSMPHYDGDGCRLISVDDYLPCFHALAPQ